MNSSAIRFPLTLSLALLAAPGAIAQLGADECVAADAINGVGAFGFDTNVATDTGVPASTSIEQQCADLTHDVWLDWTAPIALDGHIVQFDTCGATFDTEIAIWRGTCASKTALGCNEFAALCGGDGSAIEVTVVGGESYLVQIGFFSFSGGVWGSGDLTVSDLGPDPCLSAPPDAFEDNDDCASAPLISAGSYPALGIARDDDDFYRLTVPDGFRATVTGVAVGLFFQTDFRLELRTEGCVTQLSVSSSLSVEKVVVYSNRSGVQEEVVLRANLSSSIAFPLCTSYSLEITIEPEFCQPSIDDGFENNDVCSAAVPIANGFYPRLQVTQGDVDFYRFRIAGQSGMTVEAIFQEELGDIDMILYRWFQCGTINSEATGASPADNERIQFFNQAPETREYILAVFLKSQFGNDLGCYDLALTGAIDVPAASFCTGVTNSIGENAMIEILGSPVLADEDVFLRSYGLPAGVPGLFYFGPNQIQVPFGEGLRCIGGMTQRILPPVFAMGPAPAISQRELNFALPYAAALNAGSQSFQLWYRDQLGGPNGFNLSDGTTITFQ